MKLSVVIPVYNEEDSIAPMVAAVDDALRGNNVLLSAEAQKKSASAKKHDSSEEINEKINYEIIFVDDGSSDNTVDKIISINKKHIRVLSFARNFGQTSAMAAGIDAAIGEYIVTLDGDLQNDPTDIPIMLKKLEDENLDMVAGIRAKRKDGWILRKIPSLIANKLIRKITNVHIKDYGCTLKVFKSDLAKNLDLYGELHRFIPVLADIQGAKIAEMDVKHHSRQFGESKYGLNRTFKVASDLMLMAFFIKYRQRPMHLFGTLGLIAGILGVLIETYLLILKIFGEDIGGRPLFYVGILFIIASIQLITTGFIAELLMRTYFGSNNKKPYVIAKEYKGNKTIKSKKVK